MRRRGRRRSKNQDIEPVEEEKKPEEPIMPQGGADAAPKPEAGKPEKTDVIEDQHKDSPEILKKEGLLAQLFEWEGEGYDTSKLEEAVQKNSPGIDNMFKEFEQNVAKLKDIVKRMEEIEVDERFMDDIQKIRDLMTDPSKVAEIEPLLDKLKVKAKMQRYMDDIESMHTDGLEADVKAITSLMDDEKNIPEIEKKLSDLKRKVKEKFFESEIAMAFTPKPKKKVKKIKIVKTKLGVKAAPFKIQDIFLFHHNGELISHHTRRADLQSNKSQLANMLKVIQNNIKSPKRKEIRRIEFGNYKILFQDASNVTVSAAISGNERNEMFLLMKKVAELIEKKYPTELAEWKGDPQHMKGIDKYMAALIQVFIKMELKTQAKAAGEAQPPAPPKPA